MSTVELYDADQAAKLMRCSKKTVEAMLRDGDLEGLKPGGAWIIPATALARSLDRLASLEAAERRKPAPAPASTAPGGQQPAPAPARRGPKPRALPKLISLTGPGQAAP